MKGIMITTKTGYNIFFASGKFDDWCVYIDKNEYNHESLLDKDYFQWLLDLSKKYTTKKVYNDFLIVYNAVDSVFNENECYNLRHDIDKNYKEDTTHW